MTVLSSQVVPISQVVLKTGFTVVSMQCFSRMFLLSSNYFRCMMNFCANLLYYGVHVMCTQFTHKLDTL